MNKTRRSTRRSKRSRKVHRTSDALEIIEHRLVADDPGFAAMVEEATVNAHVAKLIYEARVAAGLTQKALAEMIGTRQPVIARLEDAEYAGHSLTMLQRIAAALGRSLEIRMRPVRGGAVASVRKAG